MVEQPILLSLWKQLNAKFYMLYLLFILFGILKSQKYRNRKEINGYQGLEQEIDYEETQGSFLGQQDCSFF